MTILVTEPPVGTIPHLSVAGRFPVESGGLALHLPPDVRRIGAIALTLLETIGKDLGVTGGNAVRNDEHIEYAPMWASAHNLDRVAVLDGQRVTAAMANHLRTLLGPQAQIIAVCESGTSRRTLRLLNRDGARAISLDWDEFLARNPVAARTNQEQADAYTMQDLPTVDFLVFRHIARQVNEPETFSAIDRDYRAAYSGGSGGSAGHRRRAEPSPRGHLGRAHDGADHDCHQGHPSRLVRTWMADARASRQPDGDAHHCPAPTPGRP